MEISSLDPLYQKLVQEAANVKQNAHCPYNPLYQKLIEEAVNVKQNAYCPYSNFRVGAAVLCDDDSIFTGCNVENASYGLCVCAERNAVMAAVAKGYRTFKAAAVNCDIKGEFKGPCGVCRQVLIEFVPDMDLYLTKPNMTYKKVTLKEMLPMAFTPRSLEEERI